MYLSINLSSYIYPQIFAAANGCIDRATDCRLARTAKLRVYVIQFPAHCARVTNLLQMWSGGVTVGQKSWKVRKFHFHVNFGQVVASDQAV